MKIVFAHDHKFRKDGDYFYSTGGLADAVLSRYVDIFGDVDVVARVIKKQKGDFKLSKITNPNVRIIKASWNGRNKLKLEKHIKKSDAVIVRLPSLIGNKAVFYARKHNKPYLIEVVGCAWDSMWNYSIKGKLAAPYMYYITRQNIKDAKFTLYVTEKFLQKRYPTNGINVACSDVVLTEYEECILQNRLQNIALKKDKYVIGTIGAIDVRYKGQEYIIRALGKLKKDSKIKYEYHLVGGGDKSYLQSIAKENGILEQVKFLGTLSHEQVFEWLDSIDIYAQPSIVEGLPRALVEAMSRAVPCFASKIGGIPELLNSEFLFNNGSNKVNEICKILRRYDEKTLEEQAKINFNNSKLYDKNLIDQRRNMLFQQFKKYIISCKN